MFQKFDFIKMITTGYKCVKTDLIEPTGALCSRLSQRGAK